jgi:hypothetical protein
MGTPPDAAPCRKRPGSRDVPRVVRIGLQLYIVVTVLTPIAGAFDSPPTATGGGTADLGALLAVLVPVCALKALFLWKAYQRRNWGRIALFAFTAFGLAAYAPGLVRALSTTPLVGIVDLALVITEAVALVLLFVPPANRWYKPAAAAVPGA